MTVKDELVIVDGKSLIMKAEHYIFLFFGDFNRQGQIYFFVEGVFVDTGCCFANLHDLLVDLNQFVDWLANFGFELALKTKERLIWVKLWNIF